MFRLLRGRMKLVLCLFLFTGTHVLAHQEDSSDLCPLHAKNWKHFLQNQQKQCLKNVDEKIDNLETTVTGELRQFQKDSQSSDEKMEKALDEMKNEMKATYQEFKSSILAEVNAALKIASSDIVERVGTSLNLVKEKLPAIDMLVECMHWKAKVSGLKLTRLETGIYFYYETYNTTWTQANRFCDDHGLKLAVITSEKEKKLLEDASPKKGGGADYWVSASDIGRTAGQFFWTDGRQVETNWWDKIHNKPDSFRSGQETCVFFNPTYGLWDSRCTSVLYFLCKAEEKHTVC